LLHALTNSFLAATSLTREPFAGKVAAMMVAMFCGGAVSPVVKKNIYIYTQEVRSPCGSYGILWCAACNVDFLITAVAELVCIAL
jgi:hypothetical protein